MKDEISILANNAYYLLAGLDSIAQRDSNIGKAYLFCNRYYRPQVDEILDELRSKNCKISYRDFDVDKLFPIIIFDEEQVKFTLSKLDVLKSEETMLNLYNHNM